MEGNQPTKSSQGIYTQTTSIHKYRENRWPANTVYADDAGMCVLGMHVSFQEGHYMEELAYVGTMRESIWGHLQRTCVCCFSDNAYYEKGCIV